MSPEALYAAIIESSDAAIIAKSLDGTVLTWNAGAERIFGWTAEEMVGHTIRRLLPEDRQHEEDEILARISRGERISTFETERVRKDGSRVQIAVLISPVVGKDGAIVAASKMARDITAEKQLRETLQTTEQRFRLMADNISQLAWIAEADGAIHWYNQRWYDYTGTTLEAMDGWGWQKIHHPDHVEPVTERFRQCIASGEEWEDTFPLLGADGEYRWFLSRAVPLRDDSGQIMCWFGTNTDITERRAAERQIDLLLREVNHRSKNMLAIIQSMARRTLGTESPFVPKLEARIAAMAANQDLLVDRDWRPVPIVALLDSQLGMLGDARAQVHYDGPALNLLPAAGEAIAMAVHEMATNAEKYGALSVSTGRIDIEWTLSDGQFTMRWTESSGPPVKLPEREGFGSKILVSVPKGKLRGEVDVDYPPEGFVWSLSCPATHAVD
ncbi:PAS domain S-box protein [Novosphingobium sp.]|uniref:PAS domain S-box protein n=1 Tax=Novosphingobium sp. TaxID=1874826 RepID=UPI00286DEC36|nr:PAS domain S-box protein [Novosphingobium sp.]